MVKHKVRNISKKPMQLELGKDFKLGVGESTVVEMKSRLRWLIQNKVIDEIGIVEDKDETQIQRKPKTKKQESRKFRQDILKKTKKVM